MAGKSVVLTVRILSDASKASQGLDQASTKYEKFQAGVNKLVPAATVAAGAIVAIGTKAVASASRSEQAMGALDSVFGSSAKIVKGWAAGAADSAGLAESEYAEMASVIGAQLQNMGLSMDDSLTGTKNLISLGADLAATFGGSTADAVNALSAALRGEADPAERYGLSLKQTDVNARLAEKGLTGLKGEALKAAKTQAILEMATEQAGGAVGQFGRESDTVAGQAQRMNAKFENASAALGEALLPIVAAVTEKLAVFAGWISENTTLVTVILGVIGGLAGTILLLSGVMKAAAVVQGIMAVVQGTQTAATGANTAAVLANNAAWLANPITGIIIAIIAAIAAVVAAFIWLWKNVDGFKKFFVSAWQVIKTAIAAVVNWFKSAWTTAVNVVKTIVNGFRTAVSAVFTGIRTVVSSVVNFFKSAWQGAVNVVKTIVSGVRTTFSNIFNGVRSIVQGVASWFRGVFSGPVNAVKGVINGIKGTFNSVFNAIKAPINAVKGAFDGIVNAVRSVIDWIGKIKVPKFLSGLFGAKNAAASVAAAPAAYSPFATRAAPAVPQLLSSGRSLASSPQLARAILGGAGGRGPAVEVTNVYNIQGMDSGDTIARRIRSIGQGRDRRTGGISLPRRVS